MIDLNNISNIYFIGIGGIGMSALARYFKSNGVTVSGYDKTETALTKQLVSEGINIHYTDDVSLIDAKAQLVVYTPAVPKEHTELNHYIDNGYTVVKRSDVLGAITQRSFNICIAGTHGKTTTTTMVAHILRHTGYGSNAFLGGISVNYNTNFWSSENDVCVIEADEYDRSFLKLSPNMAIITSMDPDHLDIYGTPEKVEEAFIDFSSRIKSDGWLMSKYGLKRTNELKAAHHLTYHVSDTNADVYAKNLVMENGSYRFDAVVKDWVLPNVVLNMGGKHNVENVLAAIAIAHSLQIDGEKIIAAVDAFRGVKRRFEYIVKNDTTIMVDDYAHHPEELRALISGAKALFADKKCTMIFQPHLYSRTNDLSNEFAKSLDMADEVILLPIYPARELPIPGVTSELLLSKMNSGNKKVMTKPELLEWLQHNKRDFIITAGAGDIDTMVKPISEILINQ